MATLPKTLTNSAALKLRRAQEASQAMKDYEAERRDIRAKTERLRADRLAREAVEPPPTTKKRKSSGTNP